MFLTTSLSLAIGFLVGVTAQNQKHSEDLKRVPNLTFCMETKSRCLIAWLALQSATSA